jgi:hypothetical protein
VNQNIHPAFHADTSDLSGWELPETVTTEELDAAVIKLKELEDDYDAKKKVSNEADEKFENQRVFLLELLKKANKTKYHVDGLGTVSMAIKTAVKTPKDPESKKLMIEYFQTLRPELFYHYVSVNHMTLNSYVNEQLATDSSFILPGVGEKQETPELRFRKEK